jgi:hypothetical protein
MKLIVIVTSSPAVIASELAPADDWDVDKLKKQHTKKRWNMAVSGDGGLESKR